VLASTVPNETAAQRLVDSTRPAVRRRYAASIPFAQAWAAIAATAALLAAGCQPLRPPGRSEPMQGLAQLPPIPTITTGDQGPNADGSRTAPTPLEGQMVVRGQGGGDTLPPPAGSNGTNTLPPPLSGSVAPPPNNSVPSLGGNGGNAPFDPFAPAPGQPVVPFDGGPPMGGPVLGGPVLGGPVLGGPSVVGPGFPGPGGLPGGSFFDPNERYADTDIDVTPGRTGNFQIGGTVNSDAGVAGQISVSERNFDILAFPRSWDDIVAGRAFRGAGQNFRVEAMPGNTVSRYMVSFSDPFMFGYLPYSFSSNGFYFDRRYRDWDENRVGGRLALGYRITPDLSLSVGITGQQVKVDNLRILGIPELDKIQGDHDLWTGQVKLSYFSLDHPFDPTEGYALDLTYDQTFGSFDYPRGIIDYRRYFMVSQRPDGSGRHTLATMFNFGFSGSDTPIFENFFAGGYSTMRGFEFRGASPKVGDVQVGGRFQFLGTAEYKFPLTADDMLKGVVFCDYGTVERDIEIDWDNFRIAPGLGLRINVPALGPAPLAFDFGFPITHADGDERQVFSFYMGFTR
jgi:outer membrane protein insertion porin family